MKSWKISKVYTDSAEFNFEYDKDGNICYVDSFVPWYVNKDGLIIPNYNRKNWKKHCRSWKGIKRTGIELFKQIKKS